jgi:hypothetical protein
LRIEIINDPNKRQEFVEQLSAEIPNASEAEQAVMLAAIRILSQPNINADVITDVINKLAKVEGQSHLKDLAASEFCNEAGLDMIDPSGLFAAFELIDAVSKGDMKTAQEKAMMLVALKIASAALCTIS